MSKITDKDRLDFLQKLNDRENYTGLCCLRESRTGRGWRLHETSFGSNSANCFSSVREAIDYQIRIGNMINEYREENHEQT